MTVTVVCNQCGYPLEGAYASECPRCASSVIPLTATGLQQRSGVGKAFLVWVVNVVALFVLQLVGAVLYLVAGAYWTGQRPPFELNAPLALVTLGATLIAHVITLALCWFVVTGTGTRPFWQTLGWKWHHQFKSIHAVALALLMLVVALVLERVLPHGKTDFERLLELGFSVRIFIVVLAVGTAPFVEEIVYRGLIYTAIEKARGWKTAVTLVTLLFATVHVPQYWGSPAAIVAILSLSLVLTLLRAFTGQLLPCVATHFVFNSVQAVVLLASPPGVRDLSTTALISWMPF